MQVSRATAAQVAAALAAPAVVRQLPAGASASLLSSASVGREVPADAAAATTPPDSNPPVLRLVGSAEVTVDVLSSYQVGRPGIMCNVL